MSQKNITKPHPGFLSPPLELSLPHHDSLLCCYPEHWNSESQWMLWKSSKAESQVISKASKQTKNSLLHSGKNQRVGESLQKTSTLPSLFLNLQVGALQTVPQQSLQVAEKDAAKKLERRCRWLSSWICPAKGWLWVPHAASQLQPCGDAACRAAPRSCHFHSLPCQAPLTHHPLASLLRAKTVES